MAALQRDVLVNGRKAKQKREIRDEVGTRQQREALTHPKLLLPQLLLDDR